MNDIGANFVITEGYVVIFFKNMSPFIYHTKNVFGEGCYGTTFTVKNLIEECTVDIRLGLGVDIYCHSWYSGNKEKSVTVYIPQNYKRCVYSRYIQVRDNDGTVIRKPLFRAIADAFIKTNEAIEKDFIEHILKTYKHWKDWIIAILQEKHMSKNTLRVFRRSKTWKTFLRLRNL